MLGLPHLELFGVSFGSTGGVYFFGFCFSLAVFGRDLGEFRAELGEGFELNGSSVDFRGGSIARSSAERKDEEMGTKSADAHPKKATTPMTPSSICMP